VVTAEERVPAASVLVVKNILRHDATDRSLLSSDRGDEEPHRKRHVCGTGTVQVGTTKSVPPGEGGSSSALSPLHGQVLSHLFCPILLASTGGRLVYGRRQRITQPTSAFKIPIPRPNSASEAVLDALKMILIGASLNEVLTSVTRIIETHSEECCARFSCWTKTGCTCNMAPPQTCPKRTGQQLMECALVRMSDRAAQPLTFGSQSSSPTSFLTRILPA